MTKEEKIKKFGEVFTPDTVVKEMCDMLEDEGKKSGEDVFRPEATFLEPTCGDGAFMEEIYRRKFSRCKKRTDYTMAIKTVFGIEIQQDNVDKCIERLISVANEYFKPNKEELQMIKDHVIMGDSLKIQNMISTMNELEKRD